MNSALTDTSATCENSKQTPSKRDFFLSTFRHHQAWSLPDSLIYYITKNPSSSNCYEKLIKSCKHFFIKNPILIIPYLELALEDNECFTYFYCELIDLRNISSKLWITGEIVPST